MKSIRTKKTKLKLATDTKTSSEIQSILLRGVKEAFRSIFISYYVSENIDALMKYINDRKILSSEEYKRLLNESKDFYTVIVCALFIHPIKSSTMNFKLIELKREKKDLLYDELFRELYTFFNDWLCNIEIDPLLFLKLGISYKKPFNINLHIKSKLSYGGLTPIEAQVLRGQIVDILSCFMIEEVAIQLGLAGLDYIDYDFKFEANEVKNLIEKVDEI